MITKGYHNNIEELLKQIISISVNERGKTNYTMNDIGHSLNYLLHHQLNKHYCRLVSKNGIWMSNMNL